MYVERIDRLDALERLSPAWDAVYDADPEAQYFLSWQWMARWLAALGKDWFVLVAKPDADSATWSAILPLRLFTQEQKGGGFCSEIYMAGNYTAEYTGFLCRPEFEAEAIPALAGYVRQRNWARFNLEYVRASERRMALFMAGLSAAELEVARLDRVNREGIDNSICPYAPLPATWEAYLDDRPSANTRQKLRRLLRQLDCSGDLRITHADAETLERDLETLIRLWTEQWGAGKGPLLPDILDACRLMLRKCFADGTLLLPVLWHDDRAVGALALLVDHRRKVVHFYLGGRDIGFDGPSPGLILHAHAIRDAIANGFVEYDFQRGDESYKYSFAVEERRTRSLRVATKDGMNLGGRLDPASLPFVLRRSMEHHRAGRLAEAECGYRQALDAEPGNADALYALGQVAAARGDHAGAVKLFETLLADRPEIGKAWHRLGRSLQAGGALPPAAEAHCAAIERGVQTPGVYCDLGNILLELGLLDQAVAAFDVARGLEAGFPGIDSSLGRAHQLRRDWPARELARHAASNADLAGRVARLSAIAAAIDQRRPSTDGDRILVI